MSIGDRLGKDHLLVKHGVLAPSKSEVVEAEKLVLLASPEDAPIVLPEVRGSLNLMTDEELVACARSGEGQAVELLIVRYETTLRTVARRAAGRYRMEYDDCSVIAKAAVFRAVRTWRGVVAFRHYALRYAVGELRTEARKVDRGNGYCRVRSGGVSSYKRIARVVEDAVQSKSGDEFNHSDFAEEKERKTDQMIEILAAEQQAHNYVGSSLSLAKDGEKLAAFLRALPPFQAEEAKRMMRGLSVEESMAETGRQQKTITKARNDIDRLSEQWGLE